MIYKLYYDNYFGSKEMKKITYKIGENVDGFLRDIGPQKYNLEFREGQYDMACQVLDALGNKEHLLVEAGVGVGKTFAYLLPLLHLHVIFKKPIFIATTTIALQEQLKKDLKVLADYLSFKAEVILIKGQNHYICLKKSKKFFADREMNQDLMVLKQCIEAGTQDESKFLFHIPQNIWEKINIRKINRRECDACTYNNECQYYKTRIKLIYYKGFVLCNIDLLNAHLQLIDSGYSGILNQDESIIVVDEAHNLENKVRANTTFTIEKKAILNVIFNAEKTVSKNNKQVIQPSLRKTVNKVRDFYKTLEESIIKQIEANNYSLQDIERFEFKGDKDEFRVLASLSKSINDYVIEIELTNGFESHLSYRETEAIKELDKYNNSLKNLVDNFVNWLVWIERDFYKNNDIIKFCFCPKNTKDIIKRLYFSGNNLCIFTSATLRNSSSGALEEQYQYFINNTGFPIKENGILAEAKESPFLYEKNAMIYYCTDMPHPTKEHETFIEKGTERLIELLKISNGKALVLFTAKSDMEEVYDVLKNKDLPYKILIQSKGTSQEKVIEEFKHNIDSVLLGTGAYWEGISLEGETLSNLIIFRLPFPIPDPIIKYKTQISSNPLMDVLVPEMIIRLKQGIGRLIRNFTDKGIVSIIDGRLRDENPTPYHDIVWNSLPIKNRTTDIQKLKDFYQTLYGK